MTVQISQFPKFQFFTTSGQLAVGYKLFTYQAGTTIKSFTYIDSTGSTPNTNPVILDAYGSANIWLDITKSYKYVLASPTDADPPINPIWTADNVTATMTQAQFNSYSLPSTQLIYAKTAAESAAGVTPTDYSYPFGYLRRYGAVGDGGIDDTAAFTNNLISGCEYDLEGLTYFVGSITFPNCTIKNGTLKLKSGSRLTVPNGCTFDGVTVNANNLPVNVSAIYVISGKFNFYRSSVSNIIQSTPVSAQYGIIIKLQGGVDFSIRDSSFKNISNAGDGVLANLGFCGGVFFFGDAASLSDYAASPSRGVIDNCVFDNIYTSGASAIDYTDADAIRFYVDLWTESFDTVFPITISNCHFINVQKSCIKNAGGNGMAVRDCSIKAARVDHIMLSAIRIQTAYDCVVDGLTFDGAASYLFAISAKRLQIRNTNLTLASNVTQGLLFQNQGITSSGVLVDGGQWNGIGRLIGSNYVSGTTATNVIVSNIVTNPATPQNPHIHLVRFDGIRLEELKFSTSVAGIDVISLSESSNVSIDRCRFTTTRRVVAMDANSVTSPNIRITGCEFEITTTGIDYRMITIRPTSGTAQTPNGLVIYGCRLTRYSHTSETNDEFILVQATNIKIDNVQMLVKQISANNYASYTAINLLNSTNIQLTNISYAANFVPNVSWAGWVAKLNTCQRVTVYNIHGGVRRGVEFGNTSNCHYNNIAAVVAQTVVTVSGGSNITAGADLAAIL